MRTMWASLLFGFVIAAPAFGQGNQPAGGPFKPDLTYFESVWGLKVKSFSAEVLDQKLPDGGVRAVGRIVYTLEFGMDIANYDLDEFQRLLIFRKDGEERKIRHIFFDDDNVAFYVQYNYQFLEGDVSGVKGESFRIIVEMRPDALQQARRMVVRPGSGHR
jgi:hypothetical protein